MLFRSDNLKGSDNMTLTNDDIIALSDMFSTILDRKLVPINQRLDTMDRRFEAMDQRLDAMDRRFETIEQRLDAMDQRLDTMDKRFDRIENRLDVIEFKQDRMSEQLKEIDARQKLFEVHTNRKIAKLQDGMDTIVEILRLNNLVPV